MAKRRGEKAGRKLGGKVLLSFDVEEFDLPREHGGKISVKEGVKVSSQGLERILAVLERTGVRATFFVTGNFAKENPEAVRRIVETGHEIGAHGVDHFAPKPSDIAQARRIIEKAVGVRVEGYRQPRMGKQDYTELFRRGYKYDSSVNPAWIPGRYNNLSVPRGVYYRDEVAEIPTSVATKMRIPTFWLALHLFPFGVYLWLARRALKETEYLATYFHPWEFAEIRSFAEVPAYIKLNSGEKLARRLEKLIKKLRQDGAQFVTYREYLEQVSR